MATNKPLGLYADLLDKSASTPSATITGAPVRYEFKNNEQDAAIEKQKAKDASALRFQPVKRPQQQQKKGKSKPSTFPKPPSSGVTSSSPDKTVGGPTVQAPSTTKKLEDWAAEDNDDDYYYMGQRRDRGNNKKRKKKTDNAYEENAPVNWDSLYDLSRPNVFTDYKNSEEQSLEKDQWFRKLHMRGCRTKKARPALSNSIQRSKGAVYDTKEEALEDAKRPKMSFAPPPGDVRTAPWSKAILGNYSGERAVPSDDDAYSPPPADAPPVYLAEHPPFEYELPVGAVRQEFTDETHSLAKFANSRLKGDAHPVTQFHFKGMGTAPETLPKDPEPAPVERSDAFKAKVAEAQAKAKAAKAKMEALREANRLLAQNDSPEPQPPAPVAAQQSTGTVPVAVPVAVPITVQQSLGTISKAPVRYDAAITLPEATDAELDAAIEQAEKEDNMEKPRSKAPGQKGFAKRMMEKMGHKQGEGLGLRGEGILTALSLQAQKRKKRSDAEGGGWAQPANMGRIVGGKKRKIESTGDDEGTHGMISQVIKLQGVLKDMDVKYELEENNLMQDIGEQMKDKYGNVERLVVWRVDIGGNDEDVFVKFTNQLSALRAVNATDGMTFSGNVVNARFFDLEKFEAGEYS